MNACSASTINDFNINNNASITNSTSATLYIDLIADTNCEMCYSATNDQNTCTPKEACESGTEPFTLSSTDGSKTVYLFLYDNSVFTTSDNDSITLDTNAPVVTIVNNVVSDGNYYSYTPSAIIIKVDDNSGLNYSGFTFSQGGYDFNITIDSLTALTATLDLNDLVSGEYTITYDVNDIAGNRTTDSIEWIVDTNAPVTARKSSSTFWTNSLFPTIKITDYIDMNHPQYALSSSNADINLKCNSNSGTWKEISYTTSTDDFNIGGIAYDCNGQQGYKKVFVKVRDAAWNWSNDSNFIVGYDITTPVAPTDFSVTAGNAKGTLTWVAPTADDFSGNKGYKIYKKTGGGNFVSYDTITTVSILTKDLNLTNGTTYCFKMSTYDNAGNESSQTSEQCITPETATATISVKKDGANAEYAKNGDVLAIACTYSSSTTGAKMYWAYYNPNVTSQVLEESSSSVTSLSDTITVSTGATKYEKIGFRCEATGSSGSGTKYVILDNNAPSVSWVDTNNNLIGVTRITVSATDDKALDRVDFNFEKATYSASKDTNNTKNYYIDLNTIKFENGAYKIKAIAYDKAGSKTEIEKTITIDNVVTAKQKAQKMINTAKEKQKIANDLINYFRRESVAVPQDLNTKKQNADNLLKAAETDLNAKPETSLDESTQSVALYEEFNKNAKIDTNQTKTYVYDSNLLAEKLIQLGFNEQQAKETKDRIDNSGIERKLILVKVGDTNKSQAKIEISFTNDMNYDTIRIIEIIPKEFIDNAKKIFSDFNFRIIQEDPIIEFTIPVQKGAKATISYGIGEITSEQENKLMQENLIAKFSSPPIILDQNTTTEQVIGNALFPTQLLIIAVIILIIVIIIAIIFFVKFSHPGHGFGGEKTIAEHITSEAPKTEPEQPKWSAP